MLIYAKVSTSSLIQLTMVQVSTQISVTKGDKNYRPTPFRCNPQPIAAIYQSYDFCIVIPYGRAWTSFTDATCAEMLIDNVESSSGSIQFKERFTVVVYGEQLSNSGLLTVIVDVSSLSGHAWTSYMQLFVYASDNASLAKRQILFWDLQETMTDPNYQLPTGAAL